MANTVLKTSETLVSSTDSDYTVIENDEIILRAEAEQQNEIAALNEVDGQWKLDLGNGFQRQWQEIIAALTATINDDDQGSIDSNSSPIDSLNLIENDKVFIISLLANTSSGKSFIARHLLNSSPDDDMVNGPVSIDESQKKGATTANINCYTNRSITKQKTLVLDYEGEKGSAFPLLYYARRSLRHLSRTVEKARQRRQAVSDYFPKLAYILSDVVILIGNDDLASTDYVTRCREFALKANNGVNQMVNRPMLIIIQNKASVAQSLRYDIITRQFFEIHGKEAEDLRLYFSNIKCFCLPHKEQMQRTKTGTLDGQQIFNQQIVDLKNIFVAVSNHYIARALTHAQWLYLLQRVLVLVQSAKPVSLHTLLSEIVAHVDNQMIEISRRCFLSSYNLKPIHSPAWFDICSRFAIRVLAHCLAVKTYDQRELISERIIYEKCEKALEQLSKQLEEFQPCEALYTGRGRSSKNHDDEHSVYCYQHKGAHDDGHRTCESVYGLSSLEDFWGWASTDIWPGEFVSPAHDKMKDTIFSEIICNDLSSLVREQMGAFRQDPEATYYLFTDLLLSHQFLEEPLELFSHICFCGSSSTFTFTDSNGLLWEESDHQTHRSRLGLKRMIQNLFFASFSQSRTEAWAACRKCFRKLDAAWNRLLIHPIPSVVQPCPLSVQETPACAICFDSPRDFLFIPCGHRGVCENCADQIIYGTSRCPFCRASIIEKQRVHDV